jgi:hypothetical protein
VIFHKGIILFVAVRPSSGISRRGLSASFGASKSSSSALVLSLVGAGALLVGCVALKTDTRKVQFILPVYTTFTLIRAMYANRPAAHCYKLKTQRLLSLASLP